MTHLDGTVDHRYYVHAVERMVTIVVEKRSYSPFGERRNTAWGQPTPASFPSSTTRGFTGHEADDELGLVNMKGRIYDPALGRFLTPDPIVSRPFNGQSWNPYSYVLNNPLAFVDPSGLDGLTPEQAEDLGDRGDGRGLPGVLQAAWPVERAWEPNGPRRGSGGRGTPGGHAPSSGDSNRVVREGRAFRDTETGHTVHVNGDRVVITDAQGKIVTQFRNSRANTQQRVQSGKWEPL